MNKLKILALCFLAICGCERDGDNGIYLKTERQNEAYLREHGPEDFIYPACLNLRRYLDARSFADLKEGDIYCAYYYDVNIPAEGAGTAQPAALIYVFWVGRSFNIDGLLIENQETGVSLKIPLEEKCRDSLKAEFSENLCKAWRFKLDKSERAFLNENFFKKKGSVIRLIIDGSLGAPFPFPDYMGNKPE